MATFSESEITDIALILKSSSLLVKERLDYVATVVSDSDKTAVLTKIARYQAIEQKFSRRKSVEKNFGLEKDANDEKYWIRNQIASLLHCQDLINSGIGQSKVIRT